MSTPEEREECAMQNLNELSKSSHPLANGITQAIVGVNSMQTQMIKMSERVEKFGEHISSVSDSIATMNHSIGNLHKVIAGDPVFHIDGIIQNQANNQAAALVRHGEVMGKIASIENTRLKTLEDQMLALKTSIKTSLKIWGTVWGLAATGIVTIIEIILHFIK